MYIYATDNGHLFEKEGSFLRRDAFLNQEIYMGSLKVGQETTKLYLQQELDRLFQLINNERIEKDFIEFDYEHSLGDIIDSIFLDMKNKNFSPVISRILLIVTETPLEVSNIPREEVLRVATKLNLFYVPVGNEKRIIDEYLSLSYEEEQRAVTLSENKPLLYYNLPKITDPDFIDTIDEHEFKKNLEKEKLQRKERVLSNTINQHLKDLTLGRSNKYYIYLSSKLTEEDRKSLIKKGVQIIDLPYQFYYINERLQFLIDRKSLLYLKKDPEAPKGYTSYQSELSKLSMEYLIIDSYTRLNPHDIYSYDLHLIPMEPSSRKPLEKEITEYYHDYFEKVLTGKMLDYYYKYSNPKKEKINSQLQKVMRYQITSFLISEYGTTRSRLFNNQKFSITDIDEFLDRKVFEKAVCLTEKEEQQIYRYNRKLLQELEELKKTNITSDYRKNCQERILNLLLEEIRFEKTISAVFVYDSLDPEYRKYCRSKNITSLKSYVEEIPIELFYNLEHTTGNQVLQNFLHHFDEFLDDCEQNGVNGTLIERVRGKSEPISYFTNVLIQKNGHVHNFYERDERYLSIECQLVLKKSLEVKDIKKYLDMDQQVERFRKEFIEKAVYDHRFFYRFLYDDYKRYQKNRNHEVTRLNFISKRYEKKQNDLLSDLLQKTYIHMVEQQISNGTYEIRPFEALKGYVESEYVNVGLMRIKHLLSSYKDFKEQEKEKLQLLRKHREEKRNTLNKIVEEYTGNNEFKFDFDQFVNIYKNEILRYFKNGFYKFKETSLVKNIFENKDQQRYELLYELDKKQLHSTKAYTLSIKRMDRVIQSLEEDFSSIFQKDKKGPEDQIIYAFHRFLKLMNKIFEHLQTNISDYSSYEICLKNIDTAENLYTKIDLRYQEIIDKNYASDNLFYYVELMNEINELIKTYQVDLKKESRENT